MLQVGNTPGGATDEAPTHEALLTVADSVTADRLHELVSQYGTYIEQYGRPYRRGSKEYEARLGLFRRRALEVEEHNRQPHRLWTAGINGLSDRSDDELAKLRGWRGGAMPQTTSEDSSSAKRGALRQKSAVVIPEDFMNWTSLHALGDVRNQGSCGSCWAITSSTLLEAHSELYGPDNRRSFSTQELVSCVPNPHSCGGEGGCDGATVELAMNWALHHGLSSETDKPYQEITGTCEKKIAADEWSGIPGVHLVEDRNGAGMAFGMRAWERLPENQYEPLLLAVMRWGPVGVSVSASTWYAYESGVFDNCEKDSVIDHAVVLIGFGTDHAFKEKHWLIQNSWGSDWGEAGRIRILRRDDDDSEQCGIDTQPELGTGCTGGPSEVTVCGMCGILYDSVVPHFKD